MVHDFSAQFDSRVQREKIDPNGVWVEVVRIHPSNIPMMSRTQCITVTYARGQSRPAKRVLSSLLEQAKTLPDWCRISPLRIVDTSRVSGVM